jgi:hypothetical protein
MIIPVRRKRGEKGSALFLGIASLVFLIPMMGLSIDASFLYAVKGRMQAAVDGAALGAARALNMGLTLETQQTAAAQNAVNWFYANFPPGTYATTGTVMSDGSSTNTASGFYSTSVNIFPDSSNPQLDHVNVSASTNVPTWFMKWFGVNSNTINVVSQATRRAVVVMMVLDRSGSMCAVAGVAGSQPCGKTSSGSACQAMITAAKQFTGSFAPGRDYIGMVTFSSNTYVVPNSGGSIGLPDTNFQTTLGYTNNFGTGTGYIDGLKCMGGTGTPQAISLGYQLLVQTGLPGALNILLIETDGMPNTLTMNFYDSVNNKVALAAGSNCLDTSSPTNKKIGSGGFGSSSVIPKWNTIGLTLTAAPFGSTNPGLYPNTPTGMIGAVYSDDPGTGTNFDILMNQWTNPSGPQASQSTGSSSDEYNTNAPITANGCSFSGTLSNTSNPSDFAWWPTADVYGNKLNPSNAYLPVTTTTVSGITRVQQSGSNPTNWTNYHNSAINATDNAAYNARANTTYPAFVFALGLGNNSAGAPPDPILMQRMANDPNGDTFNSPAKYPACAEETGCITYSSQLQGKYVFAPTSDELAEAFLSISSQILRLNK